MKMEWTTAATAETAVAVTRENTEEDTGDVAEEEVLVEGTGMEEDPSEEIGIEEIAAATEVAIVGEKEEEAGVADTVETEEGTTGTVGKAAGSTVEAEEAAEREGEAEESPTEDNSRNRTVLTHGTKFSN